MPSITVSERIADVLKAGPATVDDIVSALERDEGGEPVKRPTVRKVLARGLATNPKPWTLVEERWSLTL
jgi:hypothetical protein